MTTKTTKKDLVEEVEELLAKATPPTDFAYLHDLLRRLVEEVKTLRADLKQSREDRDELRILILRKV